MCKTSVYISTDWTVLIVTVKRKTNVQRVHQSEHSVGIDLRNEASSNSLST